jgi:RNA polymerase sigma-70 factor (ECF subfamily)
MSSVAADSVIERVAAGDREALGELFDRYAGLVNAIARRILWDRADADDVVQVVFTQIWREAGRYDSRRGPPVAWISTLARTRALDHLRHRASRREVAGGPDNTSTLGPQTVERLAVRDALAGLSDKQRQTLELAYYQGMTQAEIAQRVDAPLGTIKTRMRTGLSRLRDVLSPLASSNAPHALRNQRTRKPFA